MQDFIGKLYDKIVCIEDDKIELGKKFDDEVEETVASLLESMSEQEVEVIKELFYKLAYSAEKNGFRLGVHTAIKFMSEALSGVVETE